MDRLEKFRTNPDIVFLFVNPAQADRMLGLISFNGAEPFMYYPGKQHMLNDNECSCQEQT